MANEIHHFDRTSTGLTTRYVLLFNGDRVANGGGFNSFAAALTNTIVQANVIGLSDVGHPGIYLGSVTEGVPAGQYKPAVFQSSGDPYTTATTTDAFVVELAPLEWDGDEDVVTLISLLSAESGPGASACTLHLNNTTTGQPIGDADVWLTIDAEGTNTVAGVLQSNSAGNVTFMLDAGTTYYVWAQKDGVNAVRGDAYVAVAD